MTNTRKFDLGDILSITTGALVSRRHIDGVGDILNFMTGVSLFPHQLPAAINACAPILLRQHPDLADIRVPEFRGATRKDQERAVYEWLQTMEVRFGATRPVTALEPGSYDPGDPIETLIEMMGEGPR